MKSRFIFPVAVLLSLLTTQVAAQNSRSLRDEERRIRQGTRSGELTRGETARLNGEKAQLRRESIRYEANDGHTGPRERQIFALTAGGLTGISTVKRMTGREGFNSV